MEILRCENLTKIYQNENVEQKALDSVSLSVNKGEFVSIVGASGSGKSTLLHIIGTVDKPTSGKVFIEGKDISMFNKTESAIFRRRNIGIIYQFYNLISTLNVEQNIKLPLKLDKKNINEIYFNELVQTLGLKEKLKKFPNELSGGEQQRTAIARAMLYRPAIVLADEPTRKLR